MKTVCSILVSILLFSIVTLAEKGDEFKKKQWAKQWEETEPCRKGLNVTKDHNVLVAAGSKEEKCLAACYMTTMGVMKDNKLVPEKIDLVFDPESKSSTSGKMYKDVSKEIVDKCKALTDKDKCEAGWKIIVCLYDETMDRGFDEDSFA